MPNYRCPTCQSRKIGRYAFLPVDGTPAVIDRLECTNCGCSSGRRSLTPNWDKPWQIEENRKSWQTAHLNSFVRLNLTEKGVQVARKRGDSIFETPREKVWLGPMWLAFSIFRDYLLEHAANVSEIMESTEIMILVDNPPHP